MADDTGLVSKRLIVLHTVGPLAGLWRIVGTVDQLQEHLQATDLPSYLEGVNFLDHENSCSLARVEPRYVLYRETMSPPSCDNTPGPSFHPNQA